MLGPPFQEKSLVIPDSGTCLIISAIRRPENLLAEFSGPRHGNSGVICGKNAPRPALARLRITAVYDAIGRKVRHMAGRKQRRVRRWRMWDKKDDAGREVLRRALFFWKSNGGECRNSYPCR